MTGKLIHAVFADPEDTQEKGIQGCAYVDLTQQDEEVDLTDEENEETGAVI